MVIKNCLRFLLAFLISFVLLSCGGGGGGGDTTPTPPSTVFNLSRYNSLSTGPVMSFTLSGSDTAGGSYTGSISITVDAPTVFEGYNVIPRRRLATLNKTGVGNILNGIATHYHKQSDGSLYKIVLDSGVTAIPTVYNPLPPTAKIGDSGVGSTLSYSNGYTEGETWTVQDGGNGLAKFIMIYTTNTIISEQDTIIVNSTGDIIRCESILWNFPSNGVTTTLTSSNRMLEILSDPALDGDITQTLPSGPIGAPTAASNTGGVFAGIQVNVAGVPISESRGFLIFPLGRLPASASIQFASISIFLNNVSFGTTSTAPIPFLLDSIDTVLFPPPLDSGDFNAASRTSRSVNFFGTDAGHFVQINVTSLLVNAQRALLPDFEVRFVFDQTTFSIDQTTTRGRIEIDDNPASPSRAPLLHIEYF